MKAGKRITVYAADCEHDSHSGHEGDFPVKVDEATWKKTPRGGTLEAWDTEQHRVILVTKQGERHGNDGFPAFATQKTAHDFWNR